MLVLQYSKLLLTVLGAFMLQKYPTDVTTLPLRRSVDCVSPVVGHAQRTVGIHGAVLCAKVAVRCQGIISLWGGTGGGGKR